MAWITFAIVIYITSVVALQCFCVKLKLFQDNLRMSDVLVAKAGISLSECSALFVNGYDSLSLNFNAADQICELSGSYPEQSSTVAEGWKVYAPIVNGQWNVWTNWGSCTVTCDGGTRTRTRMCNNPSASNSGLHCPGDSSEIESCNDYRCIDASNYYISTSMSTWYEAKATCEGMSARLVIVNDQAEQDFLDHTIDVLDHWIGMNCAANPVYCTWIDGTPTETGFTAWAPGEPKGRLCVAIGYYSNRWDDTYCNLSKFFICEYL